MHADTPTQLNPGRSIVRHLHNSSFDGAMDGGAANDALVGEPGGAVLTAPIALVGANQVAGTASDASRRRGIRGGG